MGGLYRSPHSAPIPSNHHIVCSCLKFDFYQAHSPLFKSCCLRLLAFIVIMSREVRRCGWQLNRLGSEWQSLLCSELHGSKEHTVGWVSKLKLWNALQSQAFWVLKWQPKWKIPHHKTLLHAQNYLKYCINLPAGYFYKVHIKHKWILCLNLVLVANILHYLHANYSKIYEKNSKSKPLWSAACGIRSIQSVLYSISNRLLNCHFPYEKRLFCYLILILSYA